MWSWVRGIVGTMGNRGALDNVRTELARRELMLQQVDALARRMAEPARHRRPRVA